MNVFSFLLGLYLCVEHLVTWRQLCFEEPLQSFYAWTVSSPVHAGSTVY